MREPVIGILLYGPNAQPRNASSEDKYRLLVEKMTERRWEVRTLTYHDSRREALLRDACTCDAVLVMRFPFIGPCRGAPLPVPGKPAIRNTTLELSCESTTALKSAQLNYTT